MRKLWCPYFQSEGGGPTGHCWATPAGPRPGLMGVAPFLKNAYSQSCNLGRAAEDDGGHKVRVHNMGKL